MLKVTVKVGKITNLSDARYCAGMGVDLLGFPVGPDGIDPKTFKEITNWISGPGLVAEWSDSLLPSNSGEVINQYNVDFVEISIQQLSQAVSLAKPLIVTLTPKDWQPFRSVLEKNRDQVAFIVLDVQGSHEGMALGEIIQRQFPVLFKLGDTVSQDTLSSLRTSGIALEGTGESRPGMKDYSHLSAILEQLEVLD